MNNSPPAFIIVFLGIIIAILVFFGCGWLVSRDNPIEFIDNLFDTDLEAYLLRKKNTRNLNKFLRGNFSVIYKDLEKHHCFGPHLLYEYNFVNPKSMQSIFDYNLMKIKMYLMLYKNEDASWQNVAAYIATDRNFDKFGRIFYESSYLDPIIIPEELCKELLVYRDIFPFHLSLKVFRNTAIIKGGSALELITYMKTKNNDIP